MRSQRFSILDSSVRVRSDAASLHRNPHRRSSQQHHYRFFFSGSSGNYSCASGQSGDHHRHCAACSCDNAAAYLNPDGR
jgi:hypothetical protein